MMFFLDAAFALEVIALAAGGALFLFAKAEKKAIAKLPLFLAKVVILLALLGMVCTTYYGVKYWKAGYFDRAPMMQEHPMWKK